MVFGFLKGLFQERMLSKKRVHSLTEFRKMAVHALDYLINHSKSDYERELYVLMKQNFCPASTTPRHFRPGIEYSAGFRPDRGDKKGTADFSPRGLHYRQQEASIDSYCFCESQYLFRSGCFSSNT